MSASAATMSIARFASAMPYARFPAWGTSCGATRFASRSGTSWSLTTAYVSSSSGFSSAARCEPTPIATPTSAAARARFALISRPIEKPPVIDEITRGASSRFPRSFTEVSISSRSISGRALLTSRTSFQKLYSAETFSSRMMFTCSALRCSVFDGSAISGSPRDARADDPPAAQGIPNSVLYVTVDDPAFPGMGGDVEHPAHLALDAPRDVRDARGGEVDPVEVRSPHGLEEPHVPPALRVRGEEAVHVRDEDRACGPERLRKFEHEDIPRPDRKAAGAVPHDVPEGDRREAEDDIVPERLPIERGHPAVVHRQEGGRRQGHGGQASLQEGGDDEGVEDLHIPLDPPPLRHLVLAEERVPEAMAAGEDVAEGPGAVDDEEGLRGPGELLREPGDRGLPGHAEARLVREDAPAQLHE